MNGTRARRNTRFDLLHAVAITVLGLCPHGSKAQSAPKSTAISAHLTVDADAECATTTALTERVRLRSHRIRFVDEAPDVPLLTVHVAQRSGEHRVVTLSVQWPDGQRAERRLTANSCASGLDAVALLVAMTLDPGTQRGVEPTGAAQAEAHGEADGASGQPPVPGESSTTEGATSAGTADTTESVGGDTAAAVPADEQDATKEASEQEPAPAGHLEQEEPSAPESSRVANALPPLGVERVVVGINGQLAFGVAPKAMLGLGVHVLLPLNGSRWWAPALELQLAHLWVDKMQEAGGDAELELDSAELGVCPLGLRLRPFAARTCMIASVGRITTAGSDTYEPQTYERLWASVGGVALLSLGLGRWVELQAGFGLAAPLERYGFAFLPELFHRIPSVYAYGHLGVGVGFP